MRARGAAEFTVEYLRYLTNENNTQCCGETAKDSRLNWVGAATAGRKELPPVADGVSQRCVKDILMIYKE